MLTHLYFSRMVFETAKRIESAVTSRVHVNVTSWTEREHTKSERCRCMQCNPFTYIRHTAMMLASLHFIKMSLLVTRDTFSCPSEQIPLQYLSSINYTQTCFCLFIYFIVTQKSNSSIFADYHIIVIKRTYVGFSDRYHYDHKPIVIKPSPEVPHLVLYANVLQDFSSQA